MTKFLHGCISRKLSAGDFDPVPYRRSALGIRTPDIPTLFTYLTRSPAAAADPEIPVDLIPSANLPTCDGPCSLCSRRR